MLRDKRMASRVKHLTTGKTVNYINFPQLLGIIFSQLFLTKRSNRENWIKFRDVYPSFTGINFFGKFGLMITNPDDIKKCLTSKDFDRDVATRSLHFDHALKHSLLNADGPEGWNHRKNLNPAFKFQKIYSLIPIFAKQSVKLAEILALTNGQKTDVLPIFKDFAFDIIGLAGFGYEFNSLDVQRNKISKEITKNNNKITVTDKANFEKLFEGMFSNWSFTFGLWVDKIPIKRNTDINQSIKFCHSLVLNVIDKRKEEIAKNGRRSEAETRDLLDVILSEDTQLTSQQILHDIILFFIAGHETTAGSLTSAMYYLGKYPEVQEKAFSEISKVLGNSPIEAVNSQMIGDFQYINGIIKETLRLNPPLTIITQRVATKDTTLGDYFLPKDTLVFPVCVPSHYSSKYWNNPDEFMPERFQSQDEANLPLFAFSGGPRICIGNKFSTTEMTIALIVLVKSLKWTLTPGYVWKDEPFYPTTMPKGGLPLIFQKRN